MQGIMHELFPSLFPGRAGQKQLPLLLVGLAELAGGPGPEPPLHRAPLHVVIAVLAGLGWVLSSHDTNTDTF